jgi:hypothetical protein
MAGTEGQQDNPLKFKVTALYVRCWNCGEREARQHASVCTWGGDLQEVGRFCSPCARMVARQMDSIATAVELQDAIAKWTTFKNDNDPDWRLAW